MLTSPQTPVKKEEKSGGGNKKKTKKKRVPLVDINADGRGKVTVELICKG